MASPFVVNGPSWGLSPASRIGCPPVVEFDLGVDSLLSNWGRGMTAAPKRISRGGTYSRNLNANPKVYETMQTEEYVDPDYDQYYTPFETNAPVVDSAKPVPGAKPAVKDTGVEPTAQEYAQAAGAMIKAVASIYSYHEQMKAQAAQYKGQARMADANAKLMQLGVDYSFKRGETELAAITQKYGQIRANQMTAYAARGVALGVGSSAEVAASSQLQKEVDVITAKQNALADAWGYKRQKMMFEATSQIDNKLAGKYSHWAHFGLY